ncbi:MAG: thiamine pyrophosphate-binding protein [Nitrososphaeria archaeon]
MDGWQAVIKILKEENAEIVFGLPTTHLMTPYLEEANIKPIQVRHEASAVFMAMAYSRLKGLPSVVYASPGPGVANMVPAMLEAYSSCLPVIATCPSTSTKTEGMGAFQELDQVALFRPVTKWSARVLRPERIPWFMHRAFTLAVNGKPGPVFLDFPSDVVRSEVSDFSYKRHRRVLIRPDIEVVKDAVNLIISSEKPIVVAGGGAILSRAFDEFRQFVEFFGIPFLTTPAGRGILSENHPLALGLVGLYRTDVGKRFFEDADLLINVGSRFEEFQSGAWKYFPNRAKYIQVDIDYFEMDRNWVPDVFILGDAKLALKEIIEYTKIKLNSSPPRSSRIAEVEKAKKEFEEIVEAECNDDSIPVKTKRVVKEANRVFGEGTILVNENGMQDLWSYYFPYYKVLDVLGCVPPAEQTCMGFGVVGAIGAKIAMPHMKVLCTTGDGAFQMYSQDVPTAVQYNAPVTWIILNNFSYGWPKWIQKKIFGKATATDFIIQPDFVKFAEANKCYGERVDRPRNIRSALENALKANLNGVPAILDFIIDPEDCPKGFKDFYKDVYGIG